MKNKVMKFKCFSREQISFILIGCILLTMTVGCKKKGDGWNDLRYKDNYQLYFNNPNPKTGQPYTDAEKASLGYDPGKEDIFSPEQPVILSLVLSKDINKISVIDGENLAELAKITEADRQGDKYIATFQTTTSALNVQPGSFKVLKFDIVYKDGSIGSIQFKVVAE